jgi:hypothetical protein
VALQNALDPGHELERVDVLRVVAVQQPLELEPLDEEVRRRGAVRAGPQLARKVIKGARVAPEIVDAEEVLRVAQLVPV